MIKKRKTLIKIIIIIFSVILIGVLVYLEFHLFFLTGLSRSYMSNKFNIEITKDMELTKYKKEVVFKDGPRYELHIENIGNDHLGFMEKYCKGDIWSYSKNGEHFNDGKHKYNDSYKGTFGCDEYVIYERKGNPAEAYFFKDGDTYDMILYTWY